MKNEVDFKTTILVLRKYLIPRGHYFQSKCSNMKCGCKHKTKHFQAKYLKYLGQAGMVF